MPALSNDNLAVRGYGKLIGSGSLLQPLILLLLRLSWGWILYLSGYRHLHNVDQMVQRFIGWGVPMPRLNVYISGTTEMLGGLLIMLGLGTRLISVPLIFNFMVAYATASKKTVNQFFAGPDRLDGLEKLIGDDAFPFLMLSILLLAMGPGKLSIDYILQRTLFRDIRKQT